jgi:hypothetical protein
MLRMMEILIQTLLDVDRPIPLARMVLSNDTLREHPARDVA